MEWSVEKVGTEFKKGKERMMHNGMEWYGAVHNHGTHTTFTGTDYGSRSCDIFFFWAFLGD